MKLLNIIRSSFVIVILLVLSNQVYGQYMLCSNVISNGGAVLDNSTFYLTGTVGQTTIGVMSSNTAYKVYPGFWYSVDCITGILEADSNIPLEFKLFNNYPNPFNPSTTIMYSIKERSFVKLILYDILGREVVVLINKEQDAGNYKENFNAKQLASGIYLYRLQAGKYINTKKMILLK